MTYQDTAFMVGHPAAAIAIAAITTRNSSTLTDDSKRALIDSRIGLVGSFTATGADAGFALDLGTTTAADDSNRVVIPAGHNFAGETLEIISDTSGPTLPSPVVEDTIAVGAGSAAVLDFSFAAVTGARYWGLQVATSAAEVFSLGEFWLGERKSLTSGDGRVDPGFESSYDHDLEQDDFGGRTATLEISPPRKRFSLKIRLLDPSNPDYATLDEIMRLGRSRPFWYWPPDSADPGPYLVRLTRSAARKNDSKVPQSVIKYQVDLEMLEELT